MEPEIDLKGKSRKKHMVVMTLGAFGAFVVTAIATLAFFEEGGQAIMRNALVAAGIFLIIYLIWVKVFGSYEKFYRMGV